MSRTNDTLLALAQAVADGSSVDWEHAESHAEGPDESHIVRQLQVLATVNSAAVATASTWGTLHLRGEVGHGTFGTVYRAWDSRLEREVALKLLHGRVTNEPLASAAVKEARLLAQIRHANVVTVYGADVCEQRVGIWMEFVTGRTLKEVVHEQGPFGAQEAAVIGRDLCRALAAVHKQGFVHRDIKAQNVMREAGGRTVLMDFGTGEGPTTAAAAPLAGTPVYLAPEVLAGSTPSPRSDLYSLGVLMYYLVTGQFPVTGQSLAELREHHDAGRRQRLRDARPDLPPAFVRVVDRATAADPAGRPESAGDMEALIDSALGLRDNDDTRSGTERPGPSNRDARWRTRRLATAFVVVAASLVGWMWWGGGRGPTPVRQSVAILPFANLTIGDDNDYFSDGVAQDVAAHLATLGDLRVISGTSVLRYKGRDRSLTDVGSELGVAAVVHGSVQRAGDRVRIVGQLVDAATGEQLWAESFERSVEDVFAMQSEVSRKIALALKGQLSQREAERLARASGRDFEAFNLYLKGRHAWGLRTEDALHRAIRYYEEAIQRDPQYALAHTGLADAYTSLGTYGFVPRTEAYTRAAAAAGKAVAIDGTLAEAHLSLAYAQKNQFEWARAEASFKRALELKPGVAQAHHWYSIYLTQQGRFSEAITEIKAALSLDPLSIGAQLQMASLLMMARRYEDAISQWQHTIQMDAGFVNAYRGMTSAYAHLGLYDRALDAAAEAARRTPRGGEDQELKADVGYVLAVSGRSTEAMKIVRDLTTRYEVAHETVTGTIASIYSGLGDVDAAISWLGLAQAQRDPELGYLKVDPKWDPLRADPRFNTILNSLGFTQGDK